MDSQTEEEMDTEFEEAYAAELRGSVVWGDEGPGSVTINVRNFVPEGNEFWHAIMPGVEQPDWELVRDIYELEPEIVVFKFSIDQIIECISHHWYDKQGAEELRKKFVEAIAKIDATEFVEWHGNAEA